MDENSKSITAALLTQVYYTNKSAHKSNLFGPEDVMVTYRKFVLLLESEEPASDKET